MSEKKGLLIVVSGPSGAGKGTILGTVLKKNKNIKFSVSVTTRQPREGEVDGVNYFFKTKEEYEEMLQNDAFLETQPVYNNFYGTPRAYVEDLRNKGIDVLLEIDVKGALEVKKNADDAILIFLTTPSLEVLRNRLIGRATETASDLKTRLDSALSEMRQMDKYKYVVVNDDKDECVNDILAIIHAEHCKVACNSEFINNLIKGDK